jgi:N-acetyl-alpha-D-muramate 1-phosphate uridylyltransferase
MQNRPDTLMLFAAGLGTRMRPLTDTRPKPLIEVAGKALIDHALDLAHAVGIRRIVANLHYLPDLIEDHLKGSGVITIREEPDILETGGGLRNALTLLGEGPVFVLNSDAVWTGANPLTTLAKAWDASRMDALHMLVPTTRASGHTGKGDWDLGQDGRLSRGADFVYPGAHITTTERLKTVSDKAFSLNLIWDQMIADGRLYGVIHQGGWCDVGRPDSIALAESLLRNGNV